MEFFFHFNFSEKKVLYHYYFFNLVAPTKIITLGQNISFCPLLIRAKMVMCQQLKILVR